MNHNTLSKTIQDKGSFLCVGLDTDLKKIPDFLNDFDDPVFEFNRLVIDATLDRCVAYKPNLAFYEALGDRGWVSLQKTLEYIPDTHFTIADAKRGDIGNTARMYARTFFETLSFDAVTVAPYMGRDSIDPFLEFEEKWVILLALTSNQGSRDFQFHGGSEDPLHLKVVREARSWASPDQLMFVVGATQSDHFAEVRRAADNHFFLVPGVGAQGGNLAEIFQHGATSDVGLLVNSSRGIIYAGDGGPDHFKGVANAAGALQVEMQNLLDGH